MIDDRVREVLGRIHDPCSIAAGRPISLLDMGLVREWTLEDGTLSVTFCVTFAGCTMAPHFIEAARDALAALPGVRSVLTRVDTDYVWTVDDMRAPRTALHGVPQAWRQRTTVNPCKKTRPISPARDTCASIP